MKKKVFENIDEAIAKYKEITNTDSNCPGHCNISCDKCVQESRQLVEWLEEIKRRREYNGVDNMRKITKILLNILGFILTVSVGFIAIIATLTFIIAWSAIG